MKLNILSCTFNITYTPEIIHFYNSLFHVAHVITATLFPSLSIPVPSSPPVNVTVTTQDPNIVYISWQPPPCLQQNGPITNYTLQFIDFVFANIPSVESDIVGNNITLDGRISAFRNVSFQLLAVNEAGTSSLTTPIYAHLIGGQINQVACNAILTSPIPLLPPLIFLPLFLLLSSLLLLPLSPSLLPSPLPPSLSSPSFPLLSFPPSPFLPPSPDPGTVRSLTVTGRDITSITLAWVPNPLIQPVFTRGFTYTVSWTLMTAPNEVGGGIRSGCGQ